MTTNHDSTIALLRQAAGEAPDEPFLRVGGQAFTYGEAYASVLTVARALRALGVVQGDRVGIMAGNHPETVWSWMGANAAGAIDVPFNSEARGDFLSYLIADAAPRVVIATPEHLQTLSEAASEAPEVVVTIGETEERPFGERSRQLSFTELLALGTPRVELPEPAAGDLATIMYTSGTTGASKGVALPQRYYVVQADQGRVLTEVVAGEVVYCVQPLFHMDARIYLLIALSARATIALGERFSVRNFWKDVRHHRADVIACIGTMMLLLAKQPASPDDGTQPARLAACSSTPPKAHRAFEERFDIVVTESYGMTECCYLTSTRIGEVKVGSVGTPADNVVIDVLDDDDSPVPVGEIGELCYRPTVPFMMMSAYWRKPEETLEAWRNLWFHTGDFVRRRSDGEFEYVGRKKDAIRRRGENISAWEVEQAVAKHPDIMECAAIGVASELGEEDVAVLAVIRSGSGLEPEQLHGFVSDDLARFAIPRYIEFVESLPKTASERVAKPAVRARGITPAAWDAESANAVSR
jgi:crotonobetaine/carnitine-CoA ligase